MPVYSAPVRDTKYVLDHVIGIQNYSNLPGFADATPDLVEAILSEGARFCEEVLQPLNRVGDEVGCKRNDDGSGTTPPGFKHARAPLVCRATGGRCRRHRNMAGRDCRRSCRRRSSNISAHLTTASKCTMA